MKTLLCLLVFLLSLPLFAQQQSTEIYKRSHIPSAYATEITQRAYFHKEGKMLVVKECDSGFFFHLFDTEQLKSLKKVFCKKPTRYSKIVEPLSINNKDYLVYMDVLSRSSGWKTYLREVDFETCNFTGEPFEFNPYYSPDSTKILSPIFIKGTKRNDNMNFHSVNFSLLDNELNEIWKREIKMPFSEKKSDIHGYNVDNDGNAYIVCSVTEDNEATGKKEKKPYILKIGKEGEVQQIPIRTKKVLKNPFIVLTPDNRIICFGDYGQYDEKNKYLIEGFFSCKIDASNKVGEVNYINFPVEIQNVNPKQDIDANKLGRIAPLIMNPDGSFLLLYEFSTRVPVPGNVKTLKNHVLFKIDSNQKLEWTRSLPKWSLDDVFYDYDPYFWTEMGRRFEKKGNYYFIIDAEHRKNDNPNYFLFNGEGGPGFSRVSYLRTYKIDEDGNVERCKMEWDKPKKSYLNPRYSTLLDENTILFETFSKKEEFLIKVPLKKE